MGKIIHITMGLPGAGKTDWSKKYRESKKAGTGWSPIHQVDHIEYDFIKESMRYLKNPDDLMKEFIKLIRKSDMDEIIMDSLVSDESGIIKMLLLMMPIPEKVDVIKIHFWVPEPDLCKINDRGRRNKDSSISIDYMKLEEPNPESIKTKLEERSNEFNETKIEVIKHNTMIKEDWKIFRDEIVKPIAYIKDDIVESDSWSMGGSWRDCWGNGGSVSGEPESEFKTLDLIFEKVCPNISFIQYKNICNKIVVSDTRSEGDYYGGSVTYGYKYFNVKDLYRELVERGLYEIEK